MKNRLVTASVAVVVVNLTCLFAAGSTGDHYWFYAMFAIVATGLITFFGILLQNLEVEKDKVIISRSMRMAIAGLITTAYVTLLAYILFLPERTEFSEMAQNLVTNFTAVVGTVIAFFFGSEAYIERRGADRNVNE